MYVRSVNVTVTGLVAGARQRFLAKKAAQVIIFEVKHKSSQVAASIGFIIVTYIQLQASWRVLPVFSSSTKLNKKQSLQAFICIEHQFFHVQGFSCLNWNTVSNSLNWHIFTPSPVVRLYTAHEPLIYANHLCQRTLKLSVFFIRMQLPLQLLLLLLLLEAVLLIVS